MAEQADDVGKAGSMWCVKFGEGWLGLGCQCWFGPVVLVAPLHGKVPAGPWQEVKLESLLP